MAHFDTTGIDEFMEQLQKVDASMRGDGIKKILQAGAKPYIDSWKGSISAHGHIRSHDMINAVGMTEVQVNEYGASVDVFPMGTDDHGVRNALKAYVIHHGVGGKKTDHTGDKFVTEAERDAEAKSVAAMQNALDQLINNT